jgi:hypothetical protein
LVSGGGLEGLPNASMLASSNRFQKFSCGLRPVTEGPGGVALVVSAAAAEGRAGASKGQS